MAQKFLSSSLTRDYQTEINRNVFDVTKKHLASYNFGKIYPIDVVHLQGKETYRVRPSVILDLEALNHELYNDIRCNILYFKVNTRSVWPEFRKFCRQDITKDTNIIHPYISRNDTNWLKVGSLAQHMGIPVVKYSSGAGNTLASFFNRPISGSNTVATISASGSPLSIPHTFDMNFRYGDPYNIRHFANVPSVGTVPFIQPLRMPTHAATYEPYIPNDITLAQLQAITASRYLPLVVIGSGLTHQVADNPVFSFNHMFNNDTETVDFPIRLFLIAGDSYADAKFMAIEDLYFDEFAPNTYHSKQYTWYRQTSDSLLATAQYPPSTSLQCYYDLRTLYICPSQSFAQRIIELQQTKPFVTIGFCPMVTKMVTIDDLDASFATTVTYPSTLLQGDQHIIFVPGFYGQPSYTSVSEISQGEVSRYAGEHPLLPLSAIPFRVYRSIYNSHFRDRIHDPLRDSQGNIMVDQYCEEIGSGPDTVTKLDFEFARYDDDLFNTCIASPTMGDDVNRPLVGITVGNDPNSFVLNYTANGDAYSIDVKTHTNASGQDQIDTVDTATNSAHANDLTYLTIKDAIQYGISLQDLKDKQALTRWYESSYRGNARFTYNDFIKAHFGEEPSLRENLEAECLGGETFHVNTAAVLNTADASDSNSPLGHKGGIAQFKGQSPEISVYADEDCYIMGVMWFSVDNLNVQSIEKFWLYQQPLDYADPAFADLGVEPVLMKQVAPLQTSPEHLNDVFGYQRIYGDKIFSFDTVAGDFTDDKSDFLMIRKFYDQPSLTADYNKMRPEELTNVFVFDNTKDKIYGRLFFDKTITTYLSQRPNASII